MDDTKTRVKKEARMIEATLAQITQLLQNSNILI